MRDRRVVEQHLCQLTTKLSLVAAGSGRTFTNGWRIARELQLSRATVSRILRRHGLHRLRSLDI
jgi:transcriptional regulator of acetoin/glycerol metabolism